MQLPRTLTIKGDSPGSLHFPPAGFLLLLSLSESCPPDHQQLQSWLSVDEMGVYQQSGARRRTDYFLGRRAAKLALMDFLGLDDPQLLSIMNDSLGRPVVYGVPVTGEVPLSLSISHGGAAAAALVHTHRLAMGLDIEPLVCKPTRIEGLRHMMSDEEQIAMKQTIGAAADGRGSCGAENIETESLYRLWCLKEALGKALGTGLAAPYKQLEIGESKRPDPRFAHSLVRSQYTQEPGFSGWSFIAGRYCFAAATPANPFWTLEVYASNNSHARKYSL